MGAAQEVHKKKINHLFPILNFKTSCLLFFFIFAPNCLLFFFPARRRSQRKVFFFPLDQQTDFLILPLLSLPPSRWRFSSWQKKKFSITLQGRKRKLFLRKKKQLGEKKTKRKEGLFLGIFPSSPPPPRPVQKTSVLKRNGIIQSTFNMCQQKKKMRNFHVLKV